MNTPLRWLAILPMLGWAIALSAQDTPRVEILDDPLGKLRIAFPSDAKPNRRLVQDIAPGITREFRYEFPDGLAVVLISTKIRPDLPKDDRILDRMTNRYVQMRYLLGEETLSYRFMGPAGNRVFESVVINPEYNQFFPLATMGDGKAEATKAVGVSQFFTLAERYIECAVFVPNTNKLARPAAVRQAQDICGQWRTAVTVPEPDARN